MESASQQVLFVLLNFCLMFPFAGICQTDSMSDVRVKQSEPGRFSHRVGVEYRQAFVLPAAPFYRNTTPELAVKNAFSGHLKYSFGLPKGVLGQRIFRDTYQGIGFGFYRFQDVEELGKPLLAYWFQKSRILKINSEILLDYEWNFGISTGWKPYDHTENPNNVIIGSKLNAYINVGLSLNWLTGKNWLITGGWDFTHFSNGNTDFPNAGLNTTGIKLGAIYDFSARNKQDDELGFSDLTVPKYPGHLSYDLVVFGSWKRRGVDFFGEKIASPYTYPVVGMYFAPMYNFGYRFRAGASVDGVYDGSANVYTEDYIVGTPQPFYRPHWNRQIAMGVSARGEYVMPVFIISVGIGTHVLHKGGDFRSTYQSIALKIRTSRKTFLHIGYSIKDFYEPNYLMLGMGFRFNRKTPSLFD